MSDQQLTPEEMMTAPAGSEHQWLRQFLGEWDCTIETTIPPDGDTQTSHAVETVRAVGDLWIVAEGTVEHAGRTASTITTLGYDPERKRFVGTFLVSMQSHLWFYEGSLDIAANCLTLDTEGPDILRPGEPARYQDVYTILDADHRELRSHMRGPTGDWIGFMVGRYHRRG